MLNSTKLGGEYRVMTDKHQVICATCIILLQSQTSRETVEAMSEV